jgi:lipid-A-disaccharide synthase
MSLINSKMKIIMVAGEVSGDLLGARLLRELMLIHPGLSAKGIGGTHMQALGFESWYPLEHLSVRGYVEVIKSLPRLLNIRRKLFKRILLEDPDIVIGIDAPDFNLSLEQKLRSRGIKTVQYVSPAIWAWRPERTKKLNRSVDRVLSIFPMEEEIFKKEGVPCSYIGHPLADDIEIEPNVSHAKTDLGLSPNVLSIALLPGSRNAEVEQLLGLMLEVAQQLVKENPNVRFFVPVVNAEHQSKVIAAVEGIESLKGRVSITIGNAKTVLIASDVAVIASGTATLEAALCKCPMVVVYKVPRLTEILMKRKAVTQFISLPNLLLGENVVTELIQSDANTDNVVSSVRKLLTDNQLRDRAISRFKGLHVDLRRDAAKRGASIVSRMIAGSICE